MKLFSLNKLAAATAVLGVALTAFSGGLSASTPPAAPGADVQLPAAASGDWWSQVQRNIAASEYHAVWQEHTLLEDGAAAWQAANRAHNLRTYFTSDGVRVIPRDSEETPAWRWGLELLAAGWAGQAESVARAEIQTDGGRVEYRRGALTEWYINNEKGLEQGFTFLQAPAGDGETLEMQVRLHGNLDAGFHAGAQRIDFTTADGVRAIEFGKLRAWDADGRDLPAEFKLADGVLSIQVAAKDARYPVIVDPLASSPAWTVEGNQMGAELGYAVASAGDVNGDGFADVIVGARLYDGGNTNGGSTWVYHGSAMGLSTTAAWVKQSSQGSAQFGFSVAPAGDVNGDGYADVIVGAPYYDDGQNDEGGAFVYLGSASGLDTAAVWRKFSDQANANFGWSVASAGDILGNGRDDVIVGAPEYNGQGAAFVYLGSATHGVNGDPHWSKVGGQADSKFGRSVASAGDVNGDGYADIIVGAPFYDSGQTNEGKVFVYHSSAFGLDGIPDWSKESGQAGARFGVSVASAGDVDGDGYADVIVGSPNYDNGQSNEGKAYVYLGSASGLKTAPDWTKESNQADAQFGLSVASAGDVNGDGYTDVIVGAPLYDDNLTDEGKAFLYLGSASGLNTAAVRSAAGGQAGANFGWSVASAGDVNGDGRVDIIVGSPYYNNGEEYEGRAFVYINHAPTATNVVINGNLTGGSVLTADYDYVDAENDPASGRTFRWRRADDNSGVNATDISGANARTYTTVAADADKYLSVCVTPKDGFGSGSEVCSAWSAIAASYVSIDNFPETLVASDTCQTSSVTASGLSGTITNVTLLLNLKYGVRSTISIYLKAPTGEILELSSGNGGYGSGYTNTLFSDAGTQSITSLPTDFNSSSTGTFRPEGSSVSQPLCNITPNAHEFFDLSGLNPNGTWTLYIIGNGLLASSTKLTVYTSHSPPVASEVAVSGTLRPGFILTGSYTYTDAEDMRERNTSYRWRRADDNTGTNAADISGATTDTYTLVAADVGKYLSFCVTPGDDLDLGSEVCSAWNGQVVKAAPGGGFSHLELWLKADAGISASDGQNVTVWTDQSANGYTASNGGSSGQTEPTLRNNAADNLNFNPVVEFDGVNNGLDLADQYIYSTNDGLTVLAAIKTDDAANTGHFVLDFGHVGGAGYGLAYGNDKVNFYAASNFGGAFRSLPHSHGTEPVIVTGKIDFGTAQNVYINGGLLDTQAITLAQLSTAEINEDSIHASSRGPVTIGRQSKINLDTDRKFDGKIAEVMVYAADLSDTDLAKAQSYLAVKYGITLAGDYLASDGTVLWSSGGGYDNDIAAIGRDDTSDLNQPKSRSVNGDAIVTIANGGTFDADVSFLAWGNDDGALTGSAQELPGGSSFPLRLAREWKVVNTHNVGAVTVSVDMSTLPFTGSDIILLVDTDNDTDFTSGTPVAYSADSYTTENAVFTGVILANGNVFTLASAQQILPSASNVTFSGTFLEEGRTLSGSYNYYDANNQLESGSTYRWLRADDNSGANAADISGANTTEYTAVAADVDKYLSFCVTPSDGIDFGSEACGVWTAIAANQAPLATNVITTNITAIDTWFVGATLAGSYTYSDPENDSEGGTTYQWYRADDAAGGNSSVISGANAQSYVAVEADIGKYLGFAVMPVDNLGKTGNEAVSAAFVGPIETGAVNTFSFDFSQATLGLPGCSEVTMPVTGLENRITDVTLLLNTEGMILEFFGHTYDSLNIFLQAPNGTILTLSTGNGPIFTDTLFSDAGNTSIISGNPPFTGTYRPEGGPVSGACDGSHPTLSSFSDFADINPNGAWTLYVSTNVGGLTADAQLTITSRNNRNPVASNAIISGTLEEGISLTGTYNYFDADNDPDSSSYRWQRADDNTGANAADIGGASSYTVTAADFGQYLRFCVTPNDGFDSGSEVCSAWSGPVGGIGSDPTNGGKADNLAAGQDYTCALSATGEVKCWGRNSSGQLGDGSTTHRSSPVNVIDPASGTALSGVTALAAFRQHTCALTSAAEVKCWGYNAYGQLGDNTTTAQHAPVSVIDPASGTALSGVTAIGAGDNHSCALTADGEVLCWGRNNYGQLGDNTTADSPVPVSVFNLSGVTALGVGATHNCALTAAGDVMCWGLNAYGQLGYNDGSTHSVVPVSVSGLSGVTSVTAGHSHTCALSNTGEVKCWGHNLFGKLGNGSGQDQTTPVSVSNLSEAMLIAAGRHHTCALISTGEVQCWGSNSNGQLGNNTTDDQSTPVSVSGLSGIAAVAGGFYHTCALTDTGGYKCWGKNTYGQLGNGTTSTEDSLVPVDVVE